MKRISYLLVFNLLVLTFSACRSLTADTLAGEWNVTELEGTAVSPTEDTPYLGFDVQEGRLYGFTGCNRLTGSLDIKTFLAGNPDLDKIGVTRMLCPNAKYENAFLSAMSKVRQQRYTKGHIEMLDESGHVVMRLEKRK